MIEPKYVKVSNNIGYDGCADCIKYFACFSDCDAKPGYHWELNPNYKEQ